MDEERKFRRYVAIVVAMLAIGAAVVVATGAVGADNWASTLAIFILISMGLIAFLVARKWSKDTKSGYPRYDERSIAIRMRAGYLALFTSMYFMLGMGFVLAVFEDEEISTIPTSEWVMVLVAVMGSIFLGLNFYLNKKGVQG